MSIIPELQWRGVVNQLTDEQNLPGWLDARLRTLYAGFDPTADSLHVGHLMALMILRRFQQAGHRPIAVVGGATGMVGDPSGKSEERNLLSVDELRANVAAIEPQLRRFLDFDCGESSAVLVNNYDWMSKFGYLEFLRDVGKHFPVNVMLAKDSVRSRLERTDSGLSYTEFSYMLLQAYDFVHLYDAHGCELQVGGSDQWGNITAGIDLARRLRGVQLYGMTCPLLTTASGVKMGKTAAGALWLDANRTSPYHFYQYWINLDDADVPGCLRYFTDLGREEIAAVMAAHEAEPGRREAHRRLAEEVTRLVHGEDGLAKAQAETEIFFRGGGAKGGAADLTVQREVSISRLDGDGFPTIDAFVAGGLAKTKSDARRLITQGGAYVNDQRVATIESCLTAADLTAESTVVLRAGKKNYAVLRFSDASS